MVVAALNEVITKNMIHCIEEYVGIMNIDDKEYCEDAPVVCYNGILTKEQKNKLDEYVQNMCEYSEKNYVLLFTETENDIIEDVNTLTFKNKV